ncbi:uncharacterized protein HD556DRAFT_1442301 [Suillus plorans]|uniref:Uncharacterized protein n=1 Tax=Suillus plorans TaxID=116603 RepID=A0A9P7AS87_9AGAM|nr:uncharacterized protein HD556DRAFT_1442301 [Suillus plorans]KAG1795445.1 hypothetical protein HD556DRAFT_1442301 [Suillus plorans]
MTHSSELPNLGSNLYSLEVMLDAIDHFDDYNARTALHEMQYKFERAFKQMQEEENCADIHGDGADVCGNEDEDAKIDVDAGAECNDEDTPHSLMPEKGTTADPLFLYTS